MNKYLLCLCLLAFPSIAYSQSMTEVLKGKSGTWTASSFSEEVLRHSPGLKQSKAKITRSKTRLKQSKIALWPRLVLLARYTRISAVDNDPLFTTSENPKLGPLVAQVDDPEAQQLWIALGEQNQKLSESTIQVPQNRWSFDAELRLPLSDWFTSLGPTKKAAEAFVESEKASYLAVENGTRFQARAQFYLLVQKRTMQKLEEARLKDAKERVRVISAAQSVGAAKASDVLRTKAFLHQIEAKLSSAKADAIIALEKTRLLTGTKDDYHTGENILQALSEIQHDKKTLVETAFEKRAETQAMKQAKKSLDHLSSSNTGDKWPKLQIVAKATLANPNPVYVPSREEFDASWQASAIVSWSPNLLFLGSAKAEEVDADRIKVDAKLMGFSDELRSDILGALAKDESNREVIIAAQKAAKSLEEVYRTKMLEYDAGTTTLLEVLAAETELSEAKTGWINANIQARVTRARLCWLTGGLIPAPQ